MKGKIEMADIVFVKASWCPYCKMAEKWLMALNEEKQEFKDLDFEIVDIDQDVERTKDFPHELVPNFWIDGKKVFEGVPNKKKLREVLEMAVEHKNSR